MRSDFEAATLATGGLASHRSAAHLLGLVDSWTFASRDHHRFDREQSRTVHNSSVRGSAEERHEHGQRRADHERDQDTHRPRFGRALAALETALERALLARVTTLRSACCAASLNSRPRVGLASRRCVRCSWNATRRLRRRRVTSRRCSSRSCARPACRPGSPARGRGLRPGLPSRCRISRVDDLHRRRRLWCALAARSASSAIVRGRTCWWSQAGCRCDLPGSGSAGHAAANHGAAAPLGGFPAMVSQQIARKVPSGTKFEPKRRGDHVRSARGGT